MQKTAINKSILVCTAQILILLCAASNFHLQAQVSTPAPILTCPGHGEDMNTTLIAPAALRADLQSTGSANSSIIVTYRGFSPQAQQAFQYAIDIWQSLLVTSVPIQIDASWEVLETSTLGAAGATTLFRDFREALRPNLWYPVALAERLSGEELNEPGEPDIVASFNSDINWYYGTDGRTPPGQYNLVSVVLHEIAHGLGFFSSFDVENNLGQWGEETGYAFIYDYFVENGNGQRLINTTLFPNPSAALARQLTSDNLFFETGSASDNAASRSQPPRLYAPSQYTEGSSVSHLDEARYPAGSENALMTPLVGRAESIYWPGELTLEMLTGMGWRIRIPGSEDAPIAVFPNPTNGTLTIDGLFEENVSDLTISVIDLVGKQLLASTFTGYRRYFTEQFDMSQFPAGLYVVQVQSSQYQFSRRVMVTR